MIKRGKVKPADIADIQRSVQRGEFRVHLQNSNMRTVARLWHADGYIVGQAGGCGYDRQGSALGEAIATLIPGDRLADLAFGNVAGVRMHGGVVCIDGGVGMSAMITVLRALGFALVDRHETDSGCIVVARTAVFVAELMASDAQNDERERAYRIALERDIAIERDWAGL